LRPAISVRDIFSAETFSVCFLGVLSQLTISKKAIHKNK